MSALVKGIIATGVAIIAYAATKKAMREVLDYTYPNSED